MADIDKHIGFSVFRLILMLVSVTGNSLILYIVMKNPKLRITSANLLLAQLSLANLVLGIAAGTRGISTILFEQSGTKAFNGWLCLVLGSPTVLGIHLSQTTMAAIALDRFLCVVFPVLYRRSETFEFAFVRFLVCLGYSLLGTFGSYIGVPFDDSHKVRVCSTSAVITVWYSNYWFFFASIFTVFIYVAYIAIYILFTRQTNSSYGKSSSQRTLFVTMTAVLASYLFFWCIPNLLNASFKIIPVSSVIKGYVGILVGVCSNISSAINIFIYSWKHPEIRKYLKRVFVGGQSSVVFPVSAVHPSHLVSLPRTRHGDLIINA
ncbi:hypothetical protein L596_007682 [Steinernema carpocapsae]|uniref:G-protein coupled receptors family 1 profile domain-containing protein n=1 Tax=Steinernema carpocapsae TaxID=34508 RepID=A0A4U5PAG9_STECR|nr:hypothetical protein L596_007682 [Steinernema carpocapsae]